jgi:hypothetical protein
MVLGRGENPVNFVSADDVASVVLDAATDEHPPGRVIDVAGPEDVTISASWTGFRLPWAGQYRCSGSRGPPCAPCPCLPAPFAPARAWQARAAVLMDGTDMAIRAQPPDGVTGRTTFAEVVESAVRSAGGNPLPGP